MSGNHAFCRKCYAALAVSVPVGTCPACGRAFDLGVPRTFLRRPFPTVVHVVRRLVLTTLLGIAAAYVVAMFQAGGNSGH